MQKFTCSILCIALFAASGCSKSDSFEGKSVYPEKGKYGLNILADGFLEAKKTEWGRYEYSVRAELPGGNSSLKIVMKSTKQGLFVCPECEVIFSEFHEPCPECGGRRPTDPMSDEWGGWNQGSDVNWVVSNVGSHFTCTVYKNRKSSDASVIFTDDCIIEFYENGAIEPTKVKTIKVKD